VSGGILYNKLSDQPVTVNPSTVIFYRHLNTSQLDRGVQLSATYLHNYQTLCHKLNRRAYVDQNNGKSTPEKDFVVVGDGKIEALTAENYCMSLGYQLPELRTIQQKLYVQNLMTLEKIPWIRAGAFLDQNDMFVFKSDLENLHDPHNKAVFPGINTQYARNVNFHNDYYALYDGKKSIIVYEMIQGALELAIHFPGRHKGVRQKIICQRTSKHVSVSRVENNILTKIAAHSCLRDMRSLYGTHLIVAKEVALFKKPKIGERFDETSIFPEFSNIDDPNSYPALTLQEVCAPAFLEDCKIHFMDFLDDLLKLSSNLAEKSKLDELLIRIYMVHYILRGDEKVNPSNDYNGCDSVNLWSSSHKGFATYLSTSLRLLQNMCPDYVPAKTVKIIKEYMQSSKTKAQLDELHSDYFTKFHASKATRTKRFIGPSTAGMIDLLISLKRSFNAKGNHTRQKRFSPFGLIGGIAALNGATSLGSGSAPLSWFGDVVGATMGLVTTQQLQVPLAELKKQAVALHNLTLNQHELEHAYTNLGRDLNRLDSANHAITLSTATLVSEYDNKMVLRNLHDTIQITLLKISQAMTNALNGHTSPYVLAPVELKQLSAKYRESNIQLSDNIKDVKTTVLVDETEIMFLFEVPVYNDRTLFQLYSVRPLPLYDDGKVMTPVPDITYFGVSVTNSEYTILSAQEQAECQKDQFCQVSDVLRKIEDSTHCVIKSFFHNVLACKMVQSQDTTGFYELHGRKLVYSVPKQENIKLICKNSSTQHHTHSTVSVHGVGLANIAPDCQVILPNDRRIFSNPTPLQETLPEANFMEIFNYLPELDNFTIEIRDQSVFNHTVFAQLNLHPVETTYNVGEKLFEDTFSLKQLLPEVVRVIIGIFCVLFLLFLPCLCFPKFRTWFKTFILWKNPAKWYTQFRGMDMSTWTRKGTKFNKSVKDIEKNQKVISKVLDPKNKPNDSEDRDFKPVNFAFSDPITKECNKRMNPSTLSAEATPYKPIFKRNTSLRTSRNSLPKVQELNEVLYAVPKPARPVSTEPEDGTSSEDENKENRPPTNARYSLRQPKEPPVVFNDAQSPTITIVTSQGFVERMIEGTDCKPRVSEQEKAAIKAAAAKAAITQTSIRNTPEPIRRNIYHPQATQAEINCLANAMKENNLSSLDVSSAGLH